jgi:hypothetical protein
MWLTDASNLVPPSPIDKCAFAEHCIAQTGTMKTRNRGTFFARSFENIASGTHAFLIAQDEEALVSC